MKRHMKHPTMDVNLEELDQIIDRGQKGRQGLARTGRRSEQHIATGRNGRPRLGLRRGRRRKVAREPVGHRGMEQALGLHD